jgi:tetratricopeptide (TPR) repeat protein
MTAVEAVPAHADAWYNLGLLYIKFKQKPKAESAFASAVQARPSHSNAQNNLGVLRMQRGDLQGAAAAFRAAIKYDRNVAPETHAMLGTVLANGGQIDAGIAAFEEALKKRPGDKAFEAALKKLRDHPQKNKK